MGEDKLFQIEAGLFAGKKKELIIRKMLGEESNEER